MHQQPRAAQAAWKPTSIQPQREAIDNRSDPPDENLTNKMDVQTVIRLVPGHRIVR